jgi:ABC-type phosphate transport system ATPase subunit
VQVRRLVGMVFQAPNPFPTMSISENVAAGLTLNQRKIKKAAKEEGMTFLREAALAKVFEGSTTLKEINKVTFVD